MLLVHILILSHTFCGSKPCSSSWISPGAIDKHWNETNDVFLSQFDISIICVRILVEEPFIIFVISTPDHFTVVDFSL